MPDRRPLIGGNWKMNTTRESAEALATAVVKGLAADVAETCDVALFPPFPYLQVVRQCVGSAPVQVGGQDVSGHEEGAFTGQTSARMLLDLGCTMTLVGHSERRHGLNESDEVLNRKVRMALASGLDVMLCVGETLEEREAGHSEQVVAKQVSAGLEGVTKADLERLSIAYEPVWAIGTGRTAAPEDAQSMHARIRADLENQYDARSATSVRIVYGGSVKPANADSILAQPDVDGGLIGGASLDAGGFLDIVRAAASVEAS
ncbi:MAG: triose-phosphate isomerase [Phycisphaerales bacterium]|nr:triose-phosphate isomerase [Phycisphaerales bacterium]